MMPKVLAAVGVLAALASAVHAAERTPVMKPNEVMRGSFTQERYLEGFKEPLRSSGKFALSPERGIVWRVEAPFPLVTVITPLGLTQESEGKTLMQLSGARAGGLFGITKMLNQVLIGDWSELEREFEVTVVEEPAGWHVEATPRDATMRSIIAHISLAGTRLAAERVEIRRSGGDYDRLVFSGQTIVSQFSDEDQALLARAGR
jgi:hypothetical protein